MISQKYTLFPGNPVPLARPRFSGTYRPKVFDSQKNLKLVSVLYITQQHDNQPFLSGPLRMHITFYMEIPKTRKKTIKLEQPHISTPDLDNLIKLACDICIGVVYKDDAIITAINAKKIYHNNPRTEFFFTQVKE